MLDFRQHFDYNMWTGVVTRKSTGRVVGTKVKVGYIRVKVEGKTYLLHRVIFHMMARRWPLEVDHRDRNRHNNRWFNLREVTHRLNHQNKGPAKKSITGVAGVTWCNSRGRWLAQIKLPDRRINLGRFTRLEDAIAARQQAEIKYGFNQGA